MSMTYAELKQAIKDYTENTEATFVANVPLFIRLAEERILKSVQLSLFRKNATANLSSGNKYLACPSDFLAPFSLSYVNAAGNKVFAELKDVSFLQEYSPDASVTGEPLYYAQFDLDYFIVAPTPETSFSVELHYMYRPQSITTLGESQSSWLSTNAEIILLYASLMEAYTFMKGEQDMMQYYTSRFQESLMGLKQLGEAKETTDEYRTGVVRRTKQ
tara:strand:- start:70 stop:720 length:651 start_codon:yes stop_codon:yes gene_type:complete